MLLYLAATPIPASAVTACILPVVECARRAVGFLRHTRSHRTQSSTCMRHCQHPAGEHRSAGDPPRSARVPFNARGGMIAQAHLCHSLLVIVLPLLLLHLRTHDKRAPLLLRRHRLPGQLRGQEAAPQQHARGHGGNDCAADGRAAGGGVRAISRRPGEIWV